jgi:hypothetical protein
VDTSTFLNILALAVSFVSLAVSGLLAMRQTLIMRHANELPILVDLTRDFRAPEFQQAQDYVLNEFPGRYPQGSPDSQYGISNLPLNLHLPNQKNDNNRIVPSSPKVAGKGKPDLLTSRDRNGRVILAEHLKNLYKKFSLINLWGRIKS